MTSKRNQLVVKCLYKCMYL